MSKYLVAAVHQSSGNAKATGNPYAIPRAAALAEKSNQLSATTPKQAHFSMMRTVLVQASKFKSL